MILFIHRKDLRIHDLPGFDYIRHSGSPSIHLLVVDPELLDDSRRASHSGVHFIKQVLRLQKLYSQCGQTLHIVEGRPAEIVSAILAEHAISEIVVHEDYTPYAVERDKRISKEAAHRGVRFTALSDRPLADPQEFQQFTGRDQPYRVFTPFYRKWLQYMERYYRPSRTVTVAELQTCSLASWISERYRCSFLWSFGEAESTPVHEPVERLQRFVEEGLAAYSRKRDAYAEEGTSGISLYLNPGALSPRDVYEPLIGRQLAESWIRQLAWRDFYLYQAMYDPDFFRYESRFDLGGLSDRHLEAWQQGRTGIPLIDAAMRELNETGRLANRLRMVTAMFLTKQLLCPFTRGEQVFRTQLADYDHILNRGGWLWSASLGFDAAPYFRIMNPVSQSRTYDPEGRYIRRWLPELARLSDKDIHLPQPDAIVDLAASRIRAVETYKLILSHKK